MYTINVCVCTLWSTTWERRYQKAIRESIHWAHWRVGRSRQLYGQKSQCSESARQLRFPCSQPAIQAPHSYQRQTLPGDPQSRERHRLLLSQSMARTRVHACVCTQAAATGQNNFKAEARRGPRLFAVVFHSENQTWTVGTAAAAIGEAPR